MFAGFALLHMPSLTPSCSSLGSFDNDSTGPIPPIKVKCRHTVQSDCAHGEEDNLYMCMLALSQYSTLQPAAK